jgi:hypothetical protein
VGITGATEAWDCGNDKRAPSSLASSSRAPRKRVVRVRLGGAAPAPGAPVLDGELPVGTLGAAAGANALALLRLGRVEEAKAAGRELPAGGVGVEVEG